MPAVSDATIRSEISRAERTGKPKTLTDGDGRGTGRLQVRIRPTKARVLVEFFAQQWRDGRRSLRKLGDYPSMSLKEARARFAADFAAPIQEGASIKLASDTAPGTVGDLFSGYVAHLKAAGKMAWVEAQKTLDKAADLFGKGRPARDVRPAEIVAFLRPIYDRGSKSMADHARSYIRSAYSWGMKADNDYRREGPRRFSIERNPAADIPTEPKQVGTRWLDLDEFREVYRWLETPDSTVTRHYTVAVRVLMLTGQRVREIAQLTSAHWNSAERTLDWGKTKNGRPHCIPVPELAARLLDDLQPGAGGLLFPSAMDPTRPVTEESLYCMLWRCRQRMSLPTFALRDLRRTWKTLAGQAGLTKAERDLIQNHHRATDVSSRHYDRYTYLPEKRAAMAKWGEWIERQIRENPIDEREAA